MDEDSEDLPLVPDDEGTDLEPLPASTVDEAVSVPVDDVSLDIGDLPDSLAREAVSVISVDDTQTTDLEPLESHATELAPPVVIPWKTTARFPALSRTLPCICAPSMPTSQLVLVEGPDTPTLELQFIVGALNDTFVFPIVIGDEECVVLGRDLLAGRVWVDSATPED